MKSIIKIFLYGGVLYLLAACAGQGGAAPDGSGGSSVGGPIGGGQGQPTIAPGADHQPGVPVDEEDDSGPNSITTPEDPEEPEDPKPGFQGPDNIKGK